jgi:hypothetical protein
MRDRRAGPWTVGIEGEVTILEPPDWSIANRIDDVLAALPPAVARRAIIYLQRASTSRRLGEALPVPAERATGQPRREEAA